MKQKLGIIASVLLLTLSYAPNAISQWVSTNGLPGGSIPYLAVNGSNIFAATCCQGRPAALLLSTNMGVSWSVIASPPGEGINVIAGNGVDVFASTGSGLFRSSDNGTNWIKMNITGSPVPNGPSPIVSGSKLFAVNLWGMYFSPDSGATWKTLDPLLIGGSVNAFAVSDERIFAAGWSGGLMPIFFSSNDGNSWQKMDSGFTHGSISFLTISGTNLFAVTDTSGIFMSSDRGRTWTAANSGLTTRDILTLAVSGTNLFAGTGDGIFLSTNNGTTWISANMGLTDTRVHSIALSGTTLVAGTNGGVFISGNNGGNWTGMNIGLANPTVSALVVSDSFIIAGTEAGEFRSTDSGSNWIMSNNKVITSFALYGKTLFGGTGSNGNVILSTDDGATWEDIFPIEVYVVYAEVMIGTNLFAATSQGVYRSTDTGTSWKPSIYGLIANALAVQGTNLFAGTGRGVSLSTDLGASWTSVNSGLTNTFVHTILVNGTKIFAGTNGGVFLSTNNGLNWMAVNSGLTDTSIMTFARKDNNLFAGSWDGRVFLSANDGTNWTAVSQGLPSDGINALSVSGKNLIAGTPATGIWRRPLSDFGINAVKENLQPLVNISLSPNPTTGIITVYKAPANIIKVTVLNVLGKNVLEISPNAPEFTLDLSKLPAGTYFARFSFANEVITRKIMKE